MNTKKVYSAMLKCAGIGNDALASSLFPISNSIGGIVGLMASSPDLAEMLQILANPLLSWVPGVAGYRQVRRRTALSKKNGQGKSKILSLILGVPSSTVLASLTGAGIGAVAGGKLGAGIGAGIGGAAAITTHIIAQLIAIARRKRTQQLVNLYLNSTGSTVANYILPGSAAYNLVKSMQRANTLLDQRILKLYGKK